MRTHILSEPAGLEWVVCAGERQAVSAFAHLKPAKRPIVTCPECDGRVTLKLGPVRRHHAAHARGSACAAIHPETALHINAKCHIGDVLRRSIGSDRPLRFRRRCVVGNAAYSPESDSEWFEVAADPCGESVNEPWIAEWDDVRVEFGVSGPAGRRVPDIALLHRGRVVGAIEVVMSHRVDADKAAMLSALGVPWLEVRASQALYQGDSAWTIETALEPEQASVPLRWRCDAHRVAHAAATETQRRRADRVAERPDCRTEIISARLVDVYGPGAAWARFQYTVVGVIDCGVLQRLSLENGHETVSVHLADSGEGREEFEARAARLIQAEYKGNLRWWVKRGAFADSPMQWARGLDAQAVRHDSRRYPRRYRFLTREQTWSLAPGMQARRWPSEVDIAAVRADVEIAARGSSRPATSRFGRS